MVQCLDWGLALGPCMLFSALAGCLVSGLAVAGVAVAVARVPIFGGRGRFSAGPLAA